MRPWLAALQDFGWKALDVTAKTILLVGLTLGVAGLIIDIALYAIRRLG